MLPTVIQAWSLASHATAERYPWGSLRERSSALLRPRCKPRCRLPPLVCDSLHRRQSRAFGRETLGRRRPRSHFRLPAGFARSASQQPRPVRSTLALLVPNQIHPPLAVMALLLAAKTDSPGSGCSSAAGLQCPSLRRSSRVNQTSHDQYAPAAGHWITIDHSVLLIDE